MKVEKQKLESPEQFEPFNLVISVETEEEARALYAIFNYVPNNRLISEDNGIRHVIGEKYKVGYGQIIAKGISYSEFYMG